MTTATLTLAYAPPQHFSLRFRPLALGSAAITLTATLDWLLQNSLPLRHIPLPALRLTNLIFAVAIGLAVLAGVLLLGPALPCSKIATPWKWTATLALAILTFITRASAAALAIPHPERPLAPGKWFALSVALYGVSLLLQSLLVAAAGTFLLVASARLNRSLLGIFAAVAHLALALGLLFAGAYRLGLPQPDPTSPRPDLQEIFQLCTRFGSITFIAIWTATTLFAAIMAAHPNTTPASPPHLTNPLAPPQRGAPTSDACRRLVRNDS